MLNLLQSRFGHNAFRAYQEVVCRSSVAGDDILLVMPTGAGKSLCYQLPGLIRGGTTLVISPLIALMEDQVAKLQALGLKAERIHANRDRATSREVCVRYLKGELDFLFIAPERLNVPGFPEMLQKRPPVLIAVDEAHCISHWGHDFRPDYRLIEERIRGLRTVPIIALTATATPIVQEDIINQLKMRQPKRFIHGFRRSNIAIEIVEARPRVRSELAMDILSNPERRPAIIYSPTRKQSEDLAETLSSKYKAAPYHAGLPPGVRDQVQSAFSNNEIEIVVATIAFGMGIDKPNIRTVVHTALPGTIESYYQEIGRAGRDGLPSRAILMFSYADTKTREWFIDQDYPDISFLEQIARSLTEDPVSIDCIRGKIFSFDGSIEKALEKLWIHGAAVIKGEEVSLGQNKKWQSSYLAQRKHKVKELGYMLNFARGTGQCRMLSLVRHFGDTADSGDPCHVCDVCAKGDCSVVDWKNSSAEEIEAGHKILQYLHENGSLSSGKLYSQTFEESGEFDRQSFEDLCRDLSSAGLVKLSRESFEKGGRTIEFNKVSLTSAGERACKNGSKEQFLIRRTTTIPTLSGSKPKKSKNRRSPFGLDPFQEKIAKELKEWRTAEAKKRGVPAFVVLNDNTIHAIAEAEPQEEDQLHGIKGLGPKKIEVFGRPILDIVDRLYKNDEVLF